MAEGMAHDVFVHDYTELAFALQKFKKNLFNKFQLNSDSMFEKLLSSNYCISHINYKENVIRLSQIISIRILKSKIMSSPPQGFFPEKKP